MQRRDAVTDAGRGRGRIAAGGVFVAAAMLASGCLATAATVGVIHITRSLGGETATVEVEATPRQVYDATVRVVNSDPAVTLVSKNDAGMTLSASRGDETASASVASLGANRAKLTVTGRSPGGREASASLARRAATRVCQELGVQYKIVEH